MSELARIFGGNPFEPAAVEPAADFELVPPGKTPVLIEGAEVKQTRAKTGHILKLTLSVLDGPCKGRKLWDNINIDNPNPQAVEIGMRSLSALSLALGIAALTDENQLLNQVVVAHVKVKNEQNEIRTYSAANQQVTPPPVAAQPPYTATPPVNQPVAPPPAAAPLTQHYAAAAAPQPQAAKPPWQR